MSKREWVLKAFNNEEVDRVPMGFWFHFLENEPQADMFETPEKMEISLKGHKKYITEFKPDFLKIMSDGFFQYPMEGGKRRVESLEDLELLQPIDASHPWIQKQVEFASEVASYDRDMVIIYNVFSPTSALKYKMMNGPCSVVDSLEKDPERVCATLDRLAAGISTMVKEVITKAGLDGIYLSVGIPSTDRMSDEQYQKYLAPSDKKVLAAANSVSGNSMLHICGWGGQRNNLALFKDYEAKVFNWATQVENVGLAEGKKIFGGDRAVLGGFPSETRSFLYKGGSKEEIQAYAKDLVAKNGKKGIMIGADCTMPIDISWEHLQWVRDALQSC